MSFPVPFKDATRNGALSAVFVVFLGLLLLHPTLGRGLQNWSYDLLFTFRPPSKSLDPAVVIYMDETSHDLLGQAKDDQVWHRLLHAELIKELDRRDVRAIVFDTLMDEPWTNKTLHASAQSFLVQNFGYTPNQVVGVQVDETLRETIRNARCDVIHAAELVQYTDEANRPFSNIKVPSDSILVPTEPDNEPWGLVNFPKEADNAIRRHNFSTNPQGLAFKVASILGKPLSHPGQSRWINYYGPPNTIPNIAYHKVFDPEGTTAQFFSNKVVYVGRGAFTTSQGNRSLDEWATPYTIWHKTDTTGVEIQATAFLNFFHEEWLTQWPWWLEVILITLVGSMSGFGLNLVRPWVAARLAILGVLILATIAFTLVWTTHYWFVWTIPVLIQIPIAFAWSAVLNSRVIYREKIVLEKTLETMRTGQGTSFPGPDISSVSQEIVPSTNHPEHVQDQAAPLAPRPGESVAPPIPDHVMISCVGRGAYGEVWLARDIIGSFHAVKVVYKRNFSSNGPYVREFNGLQKFTPISRSHPGLVNILHVGRNEADDYFFCVMEAGDDENTGPEINPNNYVPRNLGRDLSRRGHLKVTECVEVGLALSDALEFIHQKGLIHRDIKPSNIIFVQGQPKFADIGLVTEIAETGRNVTFLGTEGFIAPEGPGSAAADVFSLGKLLYEAGMGRDRQKFPELPTDLTKRPDEEHLLRLNQIILKACETDLEDRYATAKAMHQDLLKLKETMTEGDQS